MALPTPSRVFSYSKIQNYLYNFTDTIIAAQQRVQEIDDKYENLKALHVEGGASGKDEDKGKNLGIAGIFKNIARRYSRPA